MHSPTVFGMKIDYGGNILNELTSVNDAKRAATGFGPITDRAIFGNKIS
nr:hypothetical protein [Bacillus safensis]